MKRSTDPTKRPRPESLMMSFGHDPQQAGGAVKAPLYATSTFVFPDAETGKERFAAVHGDEEAQGGPIYGRLGHPGLNLAEERLRLWEDGEASLLFHSGMSAISTTLLAHLRPGDGLLFSSPVYGGTDHLIRETLTAFGVRILPFTAQESLAAITRRIHEAGMSDCIAMVFAETPANPTNDLVDLARMRRLADRFSSPERRVLLAVDNTFLGPIWQRPLDFGADLVLYSATKYLAGHSDLIAGALVGTEAAVAPVRGMRVYLGTAAGPWAAWLLSRSLETLKLRMERQASSAKVIAEWLRDRPEVSSISYLGFLTEADGDAYRIFQQQCHGAGAMIAFTVHGGEKEAFAFLNGLELVRLAVSLGSTESLAEHPATMTHSGMAQEDRDALGISDNLVRLSVGVEHPEDLMADLERGFNNLHTASLDQHATPIAVR